MARHKLLIVDDTADVLRILKEGLGRLGYDVDAHDDPTEALENYRPGYDRVILDIRMPSKNGFQLAKEIWARDPDAKICFLSSFEIHEKEARQVFSSLKSYCFIKKPVTPAGLAAHIEEHFIQN